MSKVNPRPMEIVSFLLVTRDTDCVHKSQLLPASFWQSISRSIKRNENNVEEFSKESRQLYSISEPGLLASRGDDVRQSESIENEGPRVLPITRNVTVGPKDWGHVIQGGFSRLVPTSSSRSFFSIFLLVRVTDRLI